MLLAVFLTLNGQVVHGQVPEPFLRHYGAAEGLPSNEVYVAIQDKQGYMWFGTDRGLVRYDGYEFKTYTVRDGLKDNTVFHLAVDSKNRIWAATFATGLSCVSDTGIEHVVPQGLTEQIRNTDITSFFFVEGDTLYMGAGLFCKILADQGVVKQYGHKHRGELSRKIVHGPGGQAVLYFPGSYDATRQSHTDSIPLHYSYYNNPIKDTVFWRSRNSTKNFACRFDTTVFDSRDRWLLRLDGQSGYSYQEFDKAILWMGKTSESSFWLGFEAGGAHHYQNKDGKWQVTERFLDGLTVSSVAKDREGGLWFATLEEGVFYRSSEVLTPTSGHKSPVWSVYADSAIVLAGDKLGHLYKLSGDQLHDMHFPEPSEGSYYRWTPITEILKAAGNNYWVCGWGPAFGEITYENRFEVHRFGAQRITHGLKVEPGSAGALWVGNQAYFGTLRPQGDSELVFEQIENGLRVYDLYQTSDGVVQLGTVNGLKYYREGEALLPDDDALLSEIRINIIEPLNDTTTLYGTAGHGLVVRTPSKTICIDQDNGLPSSIVTALAVGPLGEAWIGGNGWVACVRNLADGGQNVQVYGRNEGMESLQIHDLAVSNSEVMLGTSAGLIKLNPALDTARFRAVELRVTGISISQRDTVVSSSYELEYDQNRLQIEYAAVCYRCRGEVNYRYKMIGLDTLWVETTGRTITFQSLNPGTYVLELCVQNAEGIWSTPKRIEFSIASPFWQTWWFRVGIVLLMVSGSYIMFLLRIRQLKLRERARTELNNRIARLELTALRAQMNPHFTFNTLNSIQHFIADNDKKAAHSYLAKFAKLMRMTLETSKNTTISIESEIELLTLYLELESLRLDPPFEFQFKVDSDIDQSFDQIPSMLLQPILENAIWHGLAHRAEPGGRIDIQFSLLNNQLAVVIQDNGVGRARSQELREQSTVKKTSLGMTITGERLELLTSKARIGGNLHIEDLVDANGAPSGTKVTLYMPIT